MRPFCNSAILDKLLERKSIEMLKDLKKVKLPETPPEVEVFIDPDLSIIISDTSSTKMERAKNNRELLEKAEMRRTVSQS